MAQRQADDERAHSDVASNRESSLSSRLNQLLDDGKHQSAMVLSRSVLRSADVLDVEITDLTVTVVTEHFTGIHQYRANDDGEVFIEQSGEYGCTMDDVDFEFSTSTMNEDAYRRAIERITAEDGLTPPQPTYGDSSENSETETKEDGRFGGGRSIRSIFERIRQWIR